MRNKRREGRNKRRKEKNKSRKEKVKEEVRDKYGEKKRAIRNLMDRKKRLPTG